ncbi:hypothetical protein KKC60_01550 [Patescibacteria group bacterium]|nr:hypothetical protein [Patescibacteria group bacterium]
MAKKKLELNKDTLILFFLVIAVVLAIILFAKNFYTPKGDADLAEKLLREGVTDESSPDDPPKISSYDLKELIESDKDIIIINPESRENYYKKHIPGSISFPQSEILANLESIPNDKIVVVTSSGDEMGCDLSKQVARLLMENGYPDVRNHHEGWVGWEKEGFPTATENSVNTPKIAAVDLEKKLGDQEALFLLDVRDENEFAYGFIKTATNIPYYELSERLDEIPHNQMIIIYDKDGSKADLVSDELLNNEYTQIKALLGGFDEWKLKNREISK